MEAVQVFHTLYFSRLIILTDFSLLELGGSLSQPNQMQGKVNHESQNDTSSLATSVDKEQFNPHLSAKANDGGILLIFEKNHAAVFL